MRINLINWVAIWILIAPFYGCVAQNAQEIAPSKNYVTKQIKAGDFNAIEMTGSMDVEYTQKENASASVQVYGSDNLVNELKVTVENNTLFIKFKNNISIISGKNYKLKVIASSPTLKAAYLKGSGDIYLKNEINTSEMDINLYGSGDIHAKGIKCNQDFTAHLQGSGDISLTGEIIAQKATLALDGSGDIKAAGLTINEGAIILNGSGDLEVNGTVQAKTILSTELNGSGDLIVKNIQAYSVKGTLQGSGEMILKGNTITADLSLKHSGDLKANDLKAENVEACIQGSGDIYCYPTDYLRFSVTGSGDVHYKGNPTRIEVVGKDHPHLHKL